MSTEIDGRLKVSDLEPALDRVFDLAGVRIARLDRDWDRSKGTPVFTVRGRYTTRGWTEWTQGFQYGMALLQADATGDETFLEIGRRGTIDVMASHVSHIGVHDHGFNNVSTYGNLLRLHQEGRVEPDVRERDFCELALKVSGAVQAARWTPTANGRGFIHSFNGPHSLFVDTVRSLRVLALAHRLGHVLMGEGDRPIPLLGRLIDHAMMTAEFSVYYGEGRDAYDVSGRTAHESVFNTKDGQYRCPNSQQGYSPFTTWTRGLAWAICGFAEQLEFFATLSDEELAPWSERENVEAAMLRAAVATSDYYLEQTCTDGVPMWDTGAPGLVHLGDYRSGVSDPFNAWEPVDSSAAAIAAQGLYRLGRFLENGPDKRLGRRYRQAALTISRTLFAEPYLSTSPRHDGMLLHSVYHRPNGWDHIARGQKVPNGESSMWGDYHLMELAVLLRREARGGSYLTFFGCLDNREAGE